MALYTLTPMPRLGVETGSGAKLYTYEAGTSTPAFTYQDDIGTQNTNPVEANLLGLFPAIYLPVGTSYKFICKTSADVTLWTQDGIAAVPSTDDLGDVTGTAGEDLAVDEGAYLSDGSGGLNAGQWYRWDADNTYSSIYPQIAYPTTAIASGATGTFRQTGRTSGLTALTPGTVYYISATAGAITATAPANARSVGVADTATSIVLFPQEPWTAQAIPVIQTTTSTGTVNDFAITPSATALLLRCNNATTLTLTGFATPAPGKRIEIVLVGAGAVVLSNQTGSTAANQIITGLGANLTLNDGLGRATLIYDATTARWRVINYTAAATNLLRDGLQFPATQIVSTDANTLDDYEEGTWVPVLGGSGGTSGQSYSTQQGNYIKIGRLVYVQGFIELTAKGTITTNVQIQGLPFTSHSNTTGFVIGRWNNMLTNFVYIGGNVNAGTTNATLFGAAAAAANVSLLATANISDTTIMIFSFSYMSAT